MLRFFKTTFHKHFTKVREQPTYMVLGWEETATKTKMLHVSATEQPFQIGWISSLGIWDSMHKSKVAFNPRIRVFHWSTHHLGRITKIREKRAFPRPCLGRRPGSRAPPRHAAMAPPGAPDGRETEAAIAHPRARIRTRKCDGLRQERSRAAAGPSELVYWGRLSCPLRYPRGKRAEVFPGKC